MFAIRIACHNTYDAIHRLKWYMDQTRVSPYSWTLIGYESNIKSEITCERITTESHTYISTRRKVKCVNHVHDCVHQEGYLYVIEYICPTSKANGTLRIWMEAVNETNNVRRAKMMQPIINPHKTPGLKDNNSLSAVWEADAVHRLRSYDGWRTDAGWRTDLSPTC